jgi:RNA polymerase sigma-70 factor (sigma-E family)
VKVQKETGVKATDEDAFRAYVVARMDGLRRTAYLLCHNWHTADDLVAVTLDKLYRRWDRARQATSLDAYVRTMLLNAWLDERRRPWRRETVTDVLPEPPGSPPPVGDEVGLLNLLRALPARRRAVLVLRFYCDFSVEETAEALGIRVGTVKSQTSRGLEALRPLLLWNQESVHEN